MYDVYPIAIRGYDYVMHMHPHPYVFACIRHTSVCTHTPPLRIQMSIVAVAIAFAIALAIPIAICRVPSDIACSVQAVGKPMRLLGRAPWLEMQEMCSMQLVSHFVFWERVASQEGMIAIHPKKGQ